MRFSPPEMRQVGDIDLITKGLRRTFHLAALLAIFVGDIDLITKGLRLMIPATPKFNSIKLETLT